MSAQPSTAAAPNIFDKLQEIEGPLSQLDFAIKRVRDDDMTVRYIENCSTGLRQWVEEVAAAANSEAEQYNALLSDLEKRDLSIRLLQNDQVKDRDALEILSGRLRNQEAEVAEAIERAVHEVNLHMAELNAMVTNQKNELAEKDNMIEVFRIRDVEQRKTIKNYAILEPEKLKQKNTEHKKEAREDRKKITELSQTIHQRDKTISELRRGNTEVMGHLVSERAEVARLSEHIKRNDGISAGYRYETSLPSGQPLHFTINRRYHGTFTIQDPSVRPRLINNLDFTYILWASIGVGSAVSFNEWLRPSYRRDPLITDHWPDDIYDALEDMIQEELENTHPHLLKRVEWAKSISLDDIAGISEAARKALHAENHRNLRDIVMFDADELAMTKGIGKKTAEQILAACYPLVEAWDREYGAPEIAHGKESK